MKPPQRVSDEALCLVYWEKRSLLIHSFSTPPKTYPTRKQYRRKKKKPPKHVHLLIRTGSFHESFAAKHKTWGLQFLLVVSNKQNDLPIICWKFLRIRDRTPKLHKAFVAWIMVGGKNVPVCVPSAISSFCKWSCHCFFGSLAISPSLPSTTLGGYSLNHSLTHCSRIWLFSTNLDSTNFLSIFSKLSCTVHKNPLPNLHRVFRRRGVLAEPKQKNWWWGLLWREWQFCWPFCVWIHYRV